MTKKRLSLPTAGRSASVKRSCSSVGRDHHLHQDQHEPHQTEQEPRYTIRRLTHYTSMAGANAASETSVDSKVNSIKNPAVIDNEKQYR